MFQKNLQGKDSAGYSEFVAKDVRPLTGGVFFEKIEVVVLVI